MKRLIGTIIALFAFLVAAFVFENNKQTAEQKRPTVGILQTLSHPALDQIHQGIIQGLKDEGYVENKNVKIDFQNAQGDQSNLKSMSDHFKQENAALTPSPQPTISSRLPKRWPARCRRSTCQLTTQ